MAGFDLSNYGATPNLAFSQARGTLPLWMDASQGSQGWNASLNPTAGVFPYSSDPTNTATPGWGAGLNQWGKDNGWWGGTTESPSMGGAILNAGSGLSKAWMGMQAYGLAKDTLESSKAQWAKQYAATRQLTNANLEDRQTARVASNPGAYQSVGAYMGQHGVAA
jgi:hypothetical protein